MTYAIDFDGILYKNNELDRKVCKRIEELRAEGNKVVLFASRQSKAFDEAKELLNGIEFDDLVPGKYFADYYIDDRNMSIDDFMNTPTKTRNKTEMKNKETRAYDFEVRAEQNEEHGHFITGQPIVFNANTDLGWYTERISPEALANTDLRDVRFLVNHNTDMIPLARSRNNNVNSTMQMSIDESGMNIRVDLDVEGNPEAKSLYSAVKRGDVTGMSFMFTVDKDNWEDLDTEHPTREILSISRVFEVSAVTFPAYEQTSIEAASAVEALERAKTTLESAKEEQRKTELRAEIEKILKGEIEA